MLNGAIQVPASSLPAIFNQVRGPREWLMRVYDYGDASGEVRTNFQFKAPFEDPRVWAAFGATALLGAAIGFFVGKRTSR